LRVVCFILVLLLYGMTSAIGAPVLTGSNTVKVNTKIGILSIKQPRQPVTLSLFKDIGVKKSTNILR
jgi:hypothetical protein